MVRNSRTLICISMFLGYFSFHDYEKIILGTLVSNVKITRDIDVAARDIPILSTPDMDACRFAERMDLVKDIYAYHYVSQGKTTVNGIDDDEEMKMTDVSDLASPHRSFTNVKTYLIASLADNFCCVAY